MPRPMLVYGGPIYTMSSAGCVEAMLVKDGKVAALGPREVVESIMPAGCDVINLDGRAVLPGMQDCHIHLCGWALGRRQVDLKNARTVEEALEIVRKAAEAASPGEWILGGGWDKSIWVEFPDRRDLDRVSCGHPVFLSSKDGHSAWANTLALEIAGITEDTKSPPGGAILRDRTGRLTGILQDTAKQLLREHIPSASLDQYTEAVAEGIRYLQSLGLTGAHVVDGVLGLKVAQSVQEKGLLDFRLAVCLPVDALKEAVAVGLRQGFGNDYLFLGPIKMFKDGALGSSTAYMIEPYEHIPQYRGLEVMTHDQLMEAVGLAIAGGFATAIHAIGDLACRDTLDVLEHYSTESQRLGLRHRIEHAQLLTERDVPRFAKIGVIASVQPSHAVADRYMADREWGRRARWAYPFESLRASGAVLAFGSDAPVDDPDPVYGIHCAVNRNAVGESQMMAWYPQERMNVTDAVWAYTVGAAYSVNRENVLGDLSPGKFADFVVLSRDLMRLPPEEIKTAQVAATVVGGKFVYGPNW